MQTTTTVTVVDNTQDPVQETKIELEPLAHVPIVNEKKAAVGVMLATGGCMTCCLLITIMFALAIPILKLIIGRHYWDQCPIQPKIPFFLYIDGIASIIAILFPVIINVLILIQTMQAKQNGEGGNSTIKKSSLNRIRSVMTILLNLFLFIWLICGAVWTFGVYEHVSYDENDQRNYCHITFYRFTIVLLILGFFQVLGQCCCGEIGLKSTSET
jgi:hypothetical protein